MGAALFRASLLSGVPAPEEEREREQECKQEENKRTQ